MHDDTGSLFEGYTDEQLAQLVRRAYKSFSGDIVEKNTALGDRAGVDWQRAFSELLNRYTKIMLGKILVIRTVGADADDLMQECSLGLLFAARSYSPERDAAFGTYASVCMDNRLRSVIRSLKGQKNIPLSNYTELSELLENPAASEPADIGADPEARILISESVSELKELIARRLSDIEYRVFVEYLSGHSYDTIAKHLGISAKSVDNALHRVRTKLRRSLSDM